MLIVNSILIGLVLMLLVITILDRQHNIRALNTKEQEIMNLTKMIVDQSDATSKLAHEVDNTVKTSAKIFGLVNKINSGIRTSFLNIDSDITRVISMVKTLAKSQQEGIRAHNELVNYTIDEIGKIWCDICEDECEICPYESICKNWDSEDNTRPVLQINEDVTNESTECEPAPGNESPIVKDYDAQGCVGSMTIDPEDPEQLDQLLDKMKSTGMPDAVLEKYRAAIKEVLRNKPDSPKKIDVVWRSEPINKGETRFMKKSIYKGSPKNGDKLIDPNAKIVKTLEQLYKESK